jgi:hypothetical protein
MREFSKVSPQIWESKRFRSLADDSARVAYLYLLSNGHQTSAGCYRLPPAYACADMGWEAAKYDAALQALLDAQLVDVDRETSEVFVPRWFKHNPPTNEKHAQGTTRLVEKIQSDRLRELASQELEEALKKWGQRKVMPMSKELRSRFG